MVCLAGLESVEPAPACDGSGTPVAHAVRVGLTRPAALCPAPMPGRSVPVCRPPHLVRDCQGGGEAARGPLRRTEALEHLFHHRSVRRGSLGSKDDLHSEVAACILEPDDIAGLVGARDVGPVQGAQVERPGSRWKCLGIEQSGVGRGTGLQHPQQDTIRRHGAQRTHRRTRVVRVDWKGPRTHCEDGIRVGELAYRIRLGRPARWNGHREVVDLVDIGQPSGPSRVGGDQATMARFGYGRGLGRWRRGRGSAAGRRRGNERRAWAGR
jgi:hypothetical protein